MKHTILFVAVTAVVTALFAACSKDDAPKKTDAPVKNSSAVEKAINIDAESNGKTIHVLPGQTIRVKLEANHTTGYSWSLKSVDKNVLESSDEGEYQSNPHPEGMVGVGGNEVWSFKAITAGETEISLVYVRPWEKDEPPAMTFKLKVVVDAASTQLAINDAAEEFKLTEKDNGRTIKVHAGDIIRITLESNITTGYDWENADKVDKDILKLDKNDYVSDPNPEEMDGIGGRTIIVYRALKQGKAKVDLTYMQAWEPDADDIEKFSVTVEVLDRP